MLILELYKQMSFFDGLSTNIEASTNVFTNTHLLIFVIVSTSNEVTGIVLPSNEL